MGETNMALQEFQEFTGDNVDLAINEAITKLQVPSSELEYEVINRESAGFLGFGKKPAKIRARRKVSDKPVEQKKSQLAKPVKPERREKLVKKDIRNEQVPSREDKEVKEKAEIRESREQKSVSDTLKVEENRDTKEFRETKPEFKTGRQRYKKSGDRRPRREQFHQERREFRKDTEPVRERPPVRERVQEVKPVVRTEEEIQAISDAAVTFLKGVFAAMELPVEIHAQYDKDNNNLGIDFSGEDMGILIGKRGQTLDSLQYLTSLVVNKGGMAYVRVKLDTENYRSRRKDTLENLAKNIAFRVKKTRKPVALEPMNPYERRIIHSSLQGNKFVETYSEGNEPYRHVVVTLKRGSRYEDRREYRPVAAESVPTEE